MRLRTFYATDGDCLLLTSSDGHHTLIDGGRATSFQDFAWPTLSRMAHEKESLELVVVSHIDADHISGILWLAELVAKWAVYDYQRTDGGNPDFDAPDGQRPPPISKLWHNSWRAQVRDLAGDIEAFVGVVRDAVRASDFEASESSPPAAAMTQAVLEVAESIPDGIELRRIIDEHTPIPRNAPFGDLVLLRNPPHVERLGRTKLTVIGPAKKHLERLREEWRDWLAKAERGRRQGSGVDEAFISAPKVRLDMPDFSSAMPGEATRHEDVVAAIAAAAEIISKADSSKVTPPNRASIVLLAEEKKRSCLLTGDAAEEEILDGLKAAGKFSDGVFRCNVIKVQHHGSEYNLSQKFAKAVLGEHYIFCGDGAHENPDPSVVRTIIETRLAQDPAPFALWFNCSPERTMASRRKALRAAISEASRAADKDPRVTVKVLDDDKSFFDVSV